MVEGRVLGVLTGDIVDSSSLRKAGSGPISEMIDKTGMWIKDHFQDAIHAQIDVFRGDSWQMVVLEPAFAFRIGLLFRVLMRFNYGIDSRVSVGFGPVDYLPTENISTGTGLAYTLSGRGLEECLKPTRMKMSFAEGVLEGRGLNTISHLIDLQASRWTPSQAQAVAGALIELTQIEIGAGWRSDPISQQAVSQHLENAGWNQIKDALAYLEETLSTILGS